MAGIGTAKEDASIAPLGIDFHEVGICKGGGLEAVAAEGATPVTAWRYCNGMVGGLAVGSWRFGAPNSCAVVDSRRTGRPFRTFQLSRIQNTRGARKTRTNKMTCSRRFSEL